MDREFKSVIANPLATVRLYLQLNPNEVENLALRGILHVPDALLFGSELGELTAALLEAMQQDCYRADEWRAFHIGVEQTATS